MWLISAPSEHVDSDVDTDDTEIYNDSDAYDDS